MKKILFVSSILIFSSVMAQKNSMNRKAKKKPNDASVGYGSMSETSIRSYSQLDCMNVVRAMDGFIGISGSSEMSMSSDDIFSVNRFVDRNGDYMDFEGRTVSFERVHEIISKVYEEKMIEENENDDPDYVDSDVELRFERMKTDFLNRVNRTAKNREIQKKNDEKQQRKLRQLENLYSKNCKKYETNKANRQINTIVNSK